MSALRAVVVMLCQLCYHDYADVVVNFALNRLTSNIDFGMIRLLSSDRVELLKLRRRAFCQKRITVTFFFTPPH